MVGDGQGIAVPTITEFELALEVGTPEIIGGKPLRQRCAARPVARSAAALAYTCRHLAIFVQESKRISRAGIKMPSIRRPSVS